MATEQGSTPTEALPASATAVMKVVGRMLDETPAKEYLREDHLARRMTQEREARGWSQERLARELRRHGFTLAQSSISKIENPAMGSSRRAITVDEAVGLSVVFGIPLLELLVPVGVYGTNAARQMVDGPGLAQTAAEAQTALEDAVSGVAKELRSNEAQFAPVFGGELGRLCESFGIERTDEAIRAFDSTTLQAPARWQLAFMQAVLRAADTAKPRRRGPRRAGA